MSVEKTPENGLLLALEEMIEAARATKADRGEKLALEAIAW